MEGRKEVANELQGQAGLGRSAKRPEVDCAITGRRSYLSQAGSSWLGICPQEERWRAGTALRIERWPMGPDQPGFDQQRFLLAPHSDGLNPSHARSKTIQTA
jgi:hypothetical protein